MASSLLALLDDITTLLDDIGAMSKVAAKKTAGVLGDDLAVNAEKVSGVVAARELPVVWAVAKGSMVNKVIIVPLILLLSAFLPALITPVLIVGGTYLCYEGAETIWHAIKHRGKSDHSATEALLEDPNADLVAVEKDKIKGAIRTDFILSLEIIVISISTMAEVPFAKQALALCVIAILMTAGVYGLVAMIVKIDDLGLYLAKGKALVKGLGRFLLWLSPALMRGLTIVGTAAMLLVGGGILTHSLEHYLGHRAALSEWVATSASWLDGILHTGINGLAGLFVGLVVVAGVTLINRKQ
ncbi:MAG: membrane protein [Gammaproteobacteria bacterium BRH_c0]|nr:MAG: membrane protein [Gammaproteobacteria bacterium BRH_c0]